MKRLCAIHVYEMPKKNANYISAIADAWKSVGVDVCLISKEAQLELRLKLPVFAGIPQVVEAAEKNSCDELVLMTDEIMGPVYPLAELLERANACQAEAWYLARGASVHGFRCSTWEHIKNSASMGEAMASCFSKRLPVAELYDTADLIEVTKYPLLDEPLLMVRDRKCPFFMHEVFHRNYGDVITTTLGHQGQVFYNWLLKQSGWNTDLLWDYLLPTCHQQDYYQNLHLSYVVPTKGADHDWVDHHLQDHRLALVMHLYYPDKLKESCMFASRFPKQTHVIITTSDEEKRRKILEIFASLDVASLDVRVIANRGRDVSALLVGAAEVFDKYEYVCFFHDKKTLQTKPGSIGAGFAYKLQENLFASKDYVCNLIRLFYENPRLGMLSPPAPHHGDYFFTLGLDWGLNYRLTRQLAARLHYTAPIAENKMPIAPLGTCMWFRGNALKPLSDKHWQYEDFPPEPNNSDGTILHAIERIYPFACVEAGYYPAYTMSDRYAGIEYSSLHYYVRDFNRICIKHGMMSYHRNMCNALNTALRK